MSRTPADHNGQPTVIAVNGAAVAALVLGLVGVAAAFLPLIGIVLGGVLGLAGLITGVIGRRRAADDTDPRRQNLGIATGGIVASVIALIIVLLQIFGVVALSNLEVDQFDERIDSLGNLIPGIDVTEG